MRSIGLLLAALLLLAVPACGSSGDTANDSTTGADLAADGAAQNDVGPQNDSTLPDSSEDDTTTPGDVGSDLAGEADLGSASDLSADTTFDAMVPTGCSEAEREVVCKNWFATKNKCGDLLSCYQTEFQLQPGGCVNCLEQHLVCTEKTRTICQQSGVTSDACKQAAAGCVAEFKTCTNGINLSICVQN